MKIDEDRMRVLVEQAMEKYPYPARGYKVREILWELATLIEKEHESDENASSTRS